MSALITASAIAGAVFAASGITTLTLLKLLIPDKAAQSERNRVREQNELIEGRLLRSAIAHEASAAALERVAAQLEANGKI